MSGFTWNDGEVEYCQRLVQSRGNRDVPRDKVADYLRMQMMQASRDLATKHGAEHLDANSAYGLLSALLNHWNSNKLGGA